MYILVSSLKLSKSLMKIFTDSYFFYLTYDIFLYTNKYHSTEKKMHHLLLDFFNENILH